MSASSFPSRSGLWRSSAYFYFCLLLILLTACGSHWGRKGPCDGLTYKESGLGRAEYLPCAGEMIAIMDRMQPELESALQGDRAAESRARDTLRDLQALMRKAGGRDMLERWEDSSLTSMNVEIWNAFNHYQAGLMIPMMARGGVSEDQVREAREDEFRNGNRAIDQAKNLYENMR